MEENIMSKQLFEDGKVISVDGVTLECVGVSYQEVEGEKVRFGYTFREKAELDAERAEVERQATPVAESEEE
jgi:hypothetical protein